MYLVTFVDQLTGGTFGIRPVQKTCFLEKLVKVNVKKKMPLEMILKIFKE